MMLKRIAKDVLEQLERVPMCPRCDQPFKKWRHSLVDSAPICEACFAIEEERQSASRDHNSQTFYEPREDK